MTASKYNKFNTGRTKGYFPLKRWRFNTDQHPVIQSKEKCASSTAKTLFSTQELQLLVGLTNTLQCREREAVRIAIYEAARRAEKAHESAFRYATSQSTEKAHQGRSSAKQWKLPKSEKEQAVEVASKLKITDKELLRLAIIWLQRGIRDGSIEAITNSKLILFDTEAKKWSRKNPGSKAQGRTPHPGVTKLKEAARIAYEEAGLIYRQRNKAKWETTKAYLIQNGFVLPSGEDELQENLSSIDALVEIQEADNFQRVVQEQIDKLRLNEREAFEFRWTEQIPDLTQTELDRLWEEELEEARAIAESEETIDRVLEEVFKYCQALRDSMTTEEREEEERKRQEFNERFRKRFTLRSRCLRQDPFESLLRKKLDDLFDGRG